MRRALLLLLASLCVPFHLRAQNESIPVDLARALVAGGENWVEIKTGPPSQWAIETIPGFRLLGSAATTRWANVVYEPTSAVPDPAQHVVDALKEAGWIAPPRPPMPSHMERGLLPSRMPFTPDAAMLCKGDRAAMLHWVELDRTRRVLRVNYHGAPGGSLCNANIRANVYRDPYEHMPIPSLKAPRGVEIHTMGGGGGGQSFHSNAGARTDLPVAKLLEAYAEQLRAAGWRLESEATSASLGMQSWRLQQNDVQWRLTLSATAVTEQTRLLELRMYSPADMRWY